MRMFVTMIATLLGSSALADDLKPWQDHAVEVAKNELIVVDALWGQSISFWVMVPDNGLVRDGLASYMCFVLDRAGRPEGEFIIVSIMDAAAASSGDIRKLGRAECD